MCLRGGWRIVRARDKELWAEILKATHDIIESKKVMGYPHYKNTRTGATLEEIRSVVGLNRRKMTAHANLMWIGDYIRIREYGRAVIVTLRPMGKKIIEEL